MEYSVVVLEKEIGELAELAPETDEKLKACLPTFGARGNPVDVAGDADAQRYATAAEMKRDLDHLDQVVVTGRVQRLRAPQPWKSRRPVVLMVVVILIAQLLLFFLIFVFLHKHR